MIGDNEKIDEYAAAIGLTNLSHFDERRQQLQRIRNYYQNTLGQLEHVVFQQHHEHYPATLLVIVIQQEFDNKALSAYLAEHHIASRLWYCPLLPEHPALQKYTAHPLPNAQYIAQHLIGLPMHIHLTSKEINYIVSVVEKYFHHPHFQGRTYDHLNYESVSFDRRN